MVQRYERITKFARETAWTLRPEVLAIVQELLALRASGQKLSNEEIRERIGERDLARAEPRTIGGVRVLPLQGVLVPKADMFTEVSGATSLESFVAGFRAARDDPAVTAIVLDVDSPGGTVDLVPETATEILRARGSKPIVAVASTEAASAAYWIASQADELVVTPSGEVGSIGVWTMHKDISKAETKLGVKTTLVSAGKFKTERNPWEPLGAAAREEMQASVDHYYGMFLEAVAAGRGVDVDEVRRRFGQGRMVRATDALEAGMVDRIATVDEVVVGLGGSEPEPAPPPAIPLVSPGEEDDDQNAAASVKPGLFARSYAIEDIAVRSDRGGRIVEAYAAVFDTPARVTDFYYLRDNPFEDEYGTYDELLLSRVFDKSLRERGTDFQVLFNHGRDIFGVPSQRFTMPLGAPVEIRKDGRGLVTVTRYARTELAEEVLELIDAGAIRAMSFSGKVIQSRVSRSFLGGVDRVERVEIALREYGPAVFAAYADAKITGSRAMALARMLPSDERADLAKMLGTPDGAARKGTPAAEPPTHPDTSSQAGHEPPAPAGPSPDLLRLRQAQRKRGL